MILNCYSKNTVAVVVVKHKIKFFIYKHFPVCTLLSLVWIITFPFIMEMNLKTVILCQ